jgi:hypothetical protein
MSRRNYTHMGHWFWNIDHVIHLRVSIMCICTQVCNNKNIFKLLKIALDEQVDFILGLFDIIFRLGYVAQKYVHMLCT